MSLKKLTAIIVLFIIIILAVFSFFYLGNINKEVPIDPSDPNFPSGGESGNSGIPGNVDPEKTNILLLPGQILDSRGEVVKKEEARLRQITKEPVAGVYIDQNKRTITEGDVIETDAGDEIEMVDVEIDEYLTYYIQKKNGHVLIDSDKENDQLKLLNNTIPQTELGVVREKFALLQYLDTTKEIIRSFGGSFVDEIVEKTVINDDGEEVIEESTETVFRSYILPNNVLFPTLSPDNKQLAFITNDGNISSIVVADILNLESGLIVYETPFLDIFPYWGNDGSLYISSKADSRSIGFLKKINLNTGGDSTIISGILGLTSLVNYDGNIIFVSNSSSETALYNKTTGEIRDTGIYTLADKCVWSKKETEVLYCMGQKVATGGQFPQDWYQGKVDFSDILWKIDYNTEDITEIYTFPGIERTFDGIKLKLSPDETRLLFVDKNDSTPWVLRLD